MTNVACYFAVGTTVPKYIMSNLFILIPVNPIFLSNKKGKAILKSCLAFTLEFEFSIWLIVELAELTVDKVK